MAVRVGLAKPVKGIPEPFVTVFFRIGCKPGDIIIAPAPMVVEIRHARIAIGAEVVELHQIWQALRIPSAWRTGALAALENGVAVTHLKFSIHISLRHFLDSQRE